MVEFIRAWVIGAVVWFLLTNIGTLVFRVLAPVEHTRSFGWALVWLGGIGFAAYFLSAVAAALVHRAPDRLRLGRNAVAVLAAPLAGTLVDTVRLLFSTGVNWPLYGSWTGIALAGAVLGFLLMRRVQGGRLTEGETGDRIRVPKTYWDREEGERDSGESGAAAEAAEVAEAADAEAAAEREPGGESGVEKAEKAEQAEKEPTDAHAERAAEDRAEPGARAEHTADSRGDDSAVDAPAETGRAGSQQ